MISITSIAQSYQIDKYKVEKVQNSWTEWRKIEGEIEINFELQLVIIQHEDNWFEFRIVEISEIYSTDGYKVCDIVMVDYSYKAHILSIIKKEATGVIFVQIDDRTNHRILYKLK